MKIMFRIGFAACISMSLVGLAVGQDYYGGYYPNQGQDYGAYGSSGYDQAYQNYGQGASSYGSPYGYPGQSGPQGYQSQDGYDQYPGVPGYGRYDNTPYGAGRYNLPSASPQESQPTLRSRLAPPIGRAGRPDVRESTRVAPPSRNQAQAVQRPAAVPTSRNSEDGALYSNEIYWDGRDSDRQRQNETSSQSQPVQSVNQGGGGRTAPSANAAIRQVKPFSNSNNQPRVQRTRPNVVRQETKSASTTPPPPPASDFKWGKEEQAGARQQATESRQSFKWGMQGKPSMVGSEPGRSHLNQEPPQVSAQGGQQDASNSLDSNSKKFQWGRVQ